MFKNKNENITHNENKGTSGFKPKNTNPDEKNTNNVEPVNNNNNNKNENENNKNSKPTTNTTSTTIHHHTTGKTGAPTVINKQTREAMLKKLGLKKVKK